MADICKVEKHPCRFRQLSRGTCFWVLEPGHPSPSNMHSEGACNDLIMQARAGHPREPRAFQQEWPEVPGLAHPAFQAQANL